METQISVFKHKINIVCHKKAELIEESFWRYATRLQASSNAYLLK